MSNQIKVGVQLKFQGFDNKSLKKITEGVENALKGIDNSVLSGKIEIDQDGLTQMKNFVANLRQVVDSLNDAINRLKVGLGTEISLSIEDGDVQKLKNVMENVLSEALTRAGRAAGEKIKNATKGTQTGTGGGERGTAGKEVSESLAGTEKEVKTRLDRIDKAIQFAESKINLDNLTKKTENFFKVMEGLFKNDGEYVTKLATEFGRQFSLSFSMAERIGADDALKEVKSYQRQLNDVLRMLTAEERKLQESGDTTSKWAKQVRGAIESASDFSHQNQILAYRLKDYQDQAKAADKITSRVVSSQARFSALIGGGLEQFEKGLKSLDPADIQGFLRPFEKLNQTLSTDSQLLQREIRRVDTLVNRYKNQLAEVKQAQSALGEGNVDQGLAKQENEIRSMIKSLGSLRERYEEQGAEITDMSTKIRQATQRFRSLERVLKQNDRFIEQVQRRNIQLQNSYDVLTRSLMAVYKTTLGKEFLDDGQLQQAKQSINKLEGSVKNLRTSLSELDVAMELEMKQLDKEFSAKGAFGAGFDLDTEGGRRERDEALEKAKQATRDRFEEMRKAGQKDLAEAEELLRSEMVKTARVQIEQTEKYKNLGKSVREVEKDMGVLVERYKKIERGHDETSDSIKRQAEVIKAARESWRSLTKTIAKLEAELAEVYNKGGKDVDGLADKIDQLRKTKDRLQAGAFSSKGIIDQGKIVADAKSLNKAESEIVDLGQTLGKLKLQFKSAKLRMAESGGTSLEAARDLRKYGSSAEEARKKLIAHSAQLRVMAAEGVKLSKEQRELIHIADKLGNEFAKMSKEVAQSEDDLKRVEKAAKRAGKGFFDFRQGLADSIVQNFQFITAISVVTSVLFGLRTAFMELIEESKAYAKVLTVMSSNTLSLGETFERVKDRIRSAAIQFGDTIENVSEIVYQLGSAGLSTEQSLAGLNQVMKLITATGGDAQSVTKAVAGAYNVFGAQLEETYGQMGTFKVITDTMTGVYRDHQVEIDELVQGLRFASAAADAAGFTFQETSGFLAVLNDNMIKSGRAGRSLQRVFAAFSLKGDAFANAFNIELDPNQNLSDQFVNVLEQVNEQLVSGRLNLTEMQKRFKLFGLRGAPAFEILSRKVEDVKRVIGELTEGSVGAADELAAITEQSLAKSFERAKQSLLDLAREGLEPVVFVLKIFSEIIQEVREVLNLGGIVTQVVFSFVTLAAVGTTLYQVFMSVIQVSSALSGRMLENMQLFFAQADAANTAAGATQRFATAQRNANAAQNEGIKTSLTAGNAFSKFTRAMGIAAVALPIFLGLLGAMNTSMEDLNREMSDLTGELNRLDRQEKTFERFSEELEGVKDDIESTSITTEKAASRIKAAFDGASGRIADYRLIIGKSNEEIVDGIDNIISGTQKQVALQKALNEAKRETLRLSISENIAGQARETFDINPYFGFLERTDIRENLDKIEKYRARIEENQETLSTLRGTGLGMEGIQQSISAQKQVVDAAQQELTDMVYQYGDLRAQISEKFADDPARLRHEIVKLNTVIKEGLDPEEWEYLMSRWHETINQNVTVPLREAKDVAAETAGVLRGFFDVVDAPIESSRFNYVIDGLKRVQAEAQMKKFEVLNVGGVAVDSASNPQPLTFNEEHFKKFVLDMVTSVSGDSAEAFNRAFAEKFDLAGAVVGRSNEGAQLTLAERFVERFADGMGNVHVTAADLHEFLKVTPELLKEAGSEADVTYQKLKLQLANMREGNYVMEERSQYLQTYLEGIEDAIRRNNTLNDAVKERLDLEKAIQDYQIASFEGESIEDVRNNIQRLEGQIVSITQQQADASEDNLKMLNEQIKPLKEQYDKYFAIHKAARQVEISDNKRLQSLHQVTISLRETRLNYESQAAAALELNDTQEKTNELKLEELELQGLLTDEFYTSAEGIKQLAERVKTLVEERHSLIESFYEENAQRYEALAITDQLLNMRNDLAGTEEKIIASAVRLSGINERISNIQGDGFRQELERVALYRKWLEEAKNLFDIREKLLKFSEKENDILDNRLQILKKIRDSFDDDASFFEDRIRSLVEKQFDIDGIDTAILLARELGNLSFEDVLADPQHAIDRFVKGIREGKIALDVLPESLREAGQAMVDLNSKQEAYNGKIKDLREKQLQNAKDAFVKYLQVGELEKAEQQLGKIQGYVQDFQEKKPVRYRKELEKLLEFEDLLLGRIGQAEEKFRIRFDLVNETDVQRFFEKLEARIAEIRKELLKAVPENIDIEKTVEGSRVFLVNGAAEALTPALEKNSANQNKLIAVIEENSSKVEDLNSVWERSVSADGFKPSSEFGEGAKLVKQGGDAILNAARLMASEGLVGSEKLLRTRQFATLSGLVDDASLRKILQFTMNRESFGGDFSALNTSTRPGGSREDVGMAYGAFQFTQSSGSLGSLLHMAYQQNPQKFNEYFGEATADLVLSATDPEMLRGLKRDLQSQLGRKEGLEEYKREIARLSGILWSPEALRGLEDFAKDSEFKKLQIKLAKDMYLEPARKFLEEEGIPISDQLLAAVFRSSIHRGVGGMREIVRGAKGGSSKDIIDELIKGSPDIAGTDSLPGIFEFLGGPSSPIMSNYQANKEATDENTSAVQELTDELSGWGRPLGAPPSGLNEWGRPLGSAPLRRQSGGHIPGYGGGDRVPALLEQGEYVLPKHVVSKYGLQFLEKLRNGEIQKFATGGSVGSASGGSAATFTDIGLAGMKSTMERFVKLWMTSREEVEAIVEQFDGLMEKQPLTAWAVDQFAEAFEGIEDLWSSFLNDVFVPKFANANAEAFDRLEERLKDIEEQFETQFETVQRGLERNESSYYDYINAVEDAERQRVQQRLEAEKQYRDELIKTKDVFKQQLGQSAGSLLGPAFKSVSEGLVVSFNEAFGTMKENTADLFVTLRRFAVNDKVIEKAKQAEAEYVAAVRSNNKQAIDEASEQWAGLRGQIVGIDEVIAKAGKAFVGLSIVAGQKLIGLIAQGLSELIKLSFDTENVDKFVTAFEDFAEELPEVAPQFVDQLIDNLDRILESITKALPGILDVLIKEIPRFVSELAELLSEYLPIILDTLADKLPELIRNLVPAITDLFNVIVDNIPNITKAIASALPALAVALAKEVLDPANLVNLFVRIQEAAVVGFITALESLWTEIKKFFENISSPGGESGILSKQGLLGIEGVPILHDGGYITGEKDEVPILAQRGEGVLSRRGLAALGGIRMLNELNDGRNPYIEGIRNLPRFHSGGVVGVNRGMATIQRDPRYRGVASRGSVQNNVNATFHVKGKMTDKEVDRMADRLTGRIDKNLSKRAKDRKSKFKDL